MTCEYALLSLLSFTQFGDSVGVSKTLRSLQLRLDGSVQYIYARYVLRGCCIRFGEIQSAIFGHFISLVFA